MIQLNPQEAKSLIKAFSTQEAQIFKKYLESLKNEIAIDFIKKQHSGNLQETYERGVFAGYLSFIDLISGQIETSVVNNEKIVEEATHETQKQTELDALKKLLAR